MNTLTAKEILIKTRDFFAANPNKWGRHGLVTVDGSYCVLGKIADVSGYDLSIPFPAAEVIYDMLDENLATRHLAHAIFPHLETATDVRPVKVVYSFNDDKFNNLNDIIKALDTAIETA